MMGPKKNILVGTLVTGAIALMATAGERSLPGEGKSPSAVRPGAGGQPPVEGKLPPLTGATAWLNTQPLTPAGLRGKVVLVEFWTYTCINWRRTLPYVRAWAQKYKDKGLVVIGVSTPEFSFEYKEENVRWAVQDMHMDFPVAMDNNYAVWNAFDNEYWPALYFVDAQGRIRHHQFGEGDYENSERVLQQLLKEAGARDIGDELVKLDPQGAETAADLPDLGCGETYVGYGRATNFASPGNVVTDKPNFYTVPSRMDVGQWALSGSWTLQKEAALLDKPGGKVVFRFRARDVNLVMGPADPAHPVRFRILIDGQLPGAAHGADIDAQGNGILDRQRMYQLIRQTKPIMNRDFTIEFLDAGAEAFDFTFG